VALEEAVAQGVQTATNFVEQMKRATQEPVRDVEKALERLGIRMGLSQGVLDEVRRSMLSERPDQQSTLYGLVNGLTRAAQSLPDEKPLRPGSTCGPPGRNWTAKSGRRQPPQALPPAHAQQRAGHGRHLVGG
jgi:hypothetical protein